MRKLYVKLAAVNICNNRQLYLHKVIEKCDRVYTAEKHQRVVASRQRNCKRNALVKSGHAV